MPVSPEVKAKAKAQVQAKALDEAQSILAQNDAYAEYLKYKSMYDKAMTLYDKIQKYRKADDKIVLTHSIKDTMDPSGTAVALGLNIKTIADKEVLKKAAKEYAKKAILGAIRNGI